MGVRRRHLLALVPALVAGCGSQSTPGPTPRESSPTASASTTADWTTPPAGTRTPGSQRPTSVTIANDALDDQYVTVAIERQGQTVFVDSQTVRGGTSRRFEGVVPDAGTYRVVVDTEAGTSGRFDWRVTDVTADLRIELETDVTFSRVVECAPECSTVSLGGTSTGYPEGGFDPRGRRAGSKLRVQNATSEPRTIDVRVAEGAVLDYRYRVPPTTTLEIPVPQRSGETRVDVGPSDQRETYRWSMEASPVLDVTLGPTVRFD